jgi:hypothetical protein
MFSRPLLCLRQYRPVRFFQIPRPHPLALYILLRSPLGRVVRFSFLFQQFFHLGHLVRAPAKHFLACGQFFLKGAFFCEIHLGLGFGIPLCRCHGLFCGTVARFDGGAGGLQLPLQVADAFESSVALACDGL